MVLLFCLRYAVFFDDEPCRSTGCLAEHDSPVGLCALEYLGSRAADCQQRQMVIIGYVEMLFQFFYRLGHEACVIDADGDSDRGGLYERHFQTMAMDDLEDLAQALFEHKGEVFGSIGPTPSAAIFDPAAPGSPKGLTKSGICLFSSGRMVLGWMICAPE